MNRWRPPPIGNPGLDSDMLHVWSLSHRDGYDLHDRLLSSDEKSRLRSIKGELNQQKFLQTRSLLRLILARYLEKPPQELCFTYSGLGKPELASNTCELQFNLTHSGNRALLAICKNTRLGIDLEPVRNRSQSIKLAKRVMGARVAEELEQLPESERSLRFTQYWTQLEASAKSQGAGVFSAPGPDIQLASHTWSPFDGWIATIASEGVLPDFKVWQLFSSDNLFPEHS